MRAIRSPATTPRRAATVRRPTARRASSTARFGQKASGSPITIDFTAAAGWRKMPLCRERRAFMFPAPFITGSAANLHSHQRRPQTNPAPNATGSARLPGRIMPVCRASCRAMDNEADAGEEPKTRREKRGRIGMRPDRVASSATAKRLDPEAQGRAAHPGSRSPGRFGTLKGCDSSPVAPLRGARTFGLANPGCAARPWAVELNAFGVAEGRIGDPPLLHGQQKIDIGLTRLLDNCVNEKSLEIGPADMPQCR